MMNQVLLIFFFYYGPSVEMLDFISTSSMFRLCSLPKLSYTSFCGLYVTRGVLCERESYESVFQPPQIRSLSVLHFMSSWESSRLNSGSKMFVSSFSGLSILLNVFKCWVNSRVWLRLCSRGRKDGFLEGRIIRCRPYISVFFNVGFLFRTKKKKKFIS